MYLSLWLLPSVEHLNQTGLIRFGIFILVRYMRCFYNIVLSELWLKDILHIICKDIYNFIHKNRV